LLYIQTLQNFLSNILLYQDNPWRRKRFNIKIWYWWWNVIIIFLSQI